MIRALLSRLGTMMRAERSPRKLAFSCALGVFIAFSPFVGLHTAMVFAFSWIFALNTALLLAVSMLINNPWTMVPIYATCHVIGDHVFYLCGIDGMQLNPGWLSSINLWIMQHTGISGISFWAFMLGGHVLGFLMSLVVYVMVHYGSHYFVDVQRS